VNCIPDKHDIAIASAIELGEIFAAPWHAEESQALAYRIVCALHFDIRGASLPIDCTLIPEERSPFWMELRGTLIYLYRLDVPIVSDSSVPRERDQDVHPIR